MRAGDDGETPCAATAWSIAICISRQRAASGSVGGTKIGFWAQALSKSNNNAAVVLVKADFSINRYLQQPG